MIEFKNVTKNYGGQTVFANASFLVSRNQRVGVVGPNGAGKTTLFEMLIGEISPDGGSVIVPDRRQLGYVRQHQSPNIGDITLLKYTENAMPELFELQDEVHAIEAALHAGSSPNREADLARLGELQTRFEQIGGYSLQHRAEAALCGLGFQAEALQEPLRTFSGGWRMRAELARCLVAVPSILLLDEPSNYLDIPAIEWLQRFLKSYNGTLLLVSHDRYLLNSLTDITLEVAGSQITRYNGNYEFYTRERGVRRENEVAAAKNQERTRRQAERFIERFRAKNTKAALVQSMIKKVERMEEIVVHTDRPVWNEVRIPEPPASGVEMVRLDDVGLTYDNERWVLRNVDFGVQRGDRIALVGMNGLGKTTLLRMLAGRLEPSAGTRRVGHRVVIGYLSQEYTETLSPTDSVFETVRAAAPDVSSNQIRTMLGGFGFSGEAIEKKVAVLSGGEKIRAAFARVFVRPPNLLLMDEPTTHLDIQAREALETALASYNGTICMVSHDIEFVRKIAKTIVAMTPPGVTLYPGDYDYYKFKTAQAEDAQPTVKNDSDSGLSRQEQRRERARLVQEYSKLRAPLRRKVERMEKTIARLETEQIALLAKLATKDESINFAELNQRLTRSQAEMQSYSAEWEEAASELERMEKEYAEARKGAQ